MDPVPLDRTPTRSGEVNAEERVLDNIVLDRAGIGIEHLHCCPVFDKARADMLEPNASDSDAVGGDGHDLSCTLTIQNRPSLADYFQRLCYDNRRLTVCACVHQYPVVRPRGSYSSRNRSKVTCTRDNG